MKTAIKKWKILATKVLLDHPEIKIVEDIVELPNGKQSAYVKQSPSSVDAVLVIAINEDGEVLIQQEYSHPPAKVMWQLPGGSMNNNETIIAAALRELSEESGYTADSAKVIGSFYVHNRSTDKQQHIVVCTDLHKHKLTEDHDEFIDNFWISREQLHTMISDGEFDNINLLAGLNLWFHSANKKKGV